MCAACCDLAPVQLIFLSFIQFVIKTLLGHSEAEIVSVGRGCGKCRGVSVVRFRPFAQKNNKSTMASPKQKLLNSLLFNVSLSRPDWYIQCGNVFIFVTVGFTFS